jgi:hypothetical protein
MPGLKQVGVLTEDCALSAIFLAAGGSLLPHEKTCGKSVIETRLQILTVYQSEGEDGSNDNYKCVMLYWCRRGNCQEACEVRTGNFRQHSEAFHGSSPPSVLDIDTSKNLSHVEFGRWTTSDSAAADHVGPKLLRK